VESAPGALQKRMDQLKDGLRRSGVKVTHQRLEIFREVAKSGDHPDAETIFKGVRRRVPSVSLDTVYRTLWLLLDLRLLTSLGPPRERMRFDANMAPHHHFVCMTCGMTTDFYHEEFNGLKIPNAVKTLGCVETAQVEVKGICLKCSRKANPGRRARRKTENE
jgi:Fur family peroxide stress response transcriptional regulator